jgi:hypothetical protein
MKKIILTFIMVAFGFGLSLQAGEDSGKAKGACADTAKAGCEASACCAKEAKAKVVTRKSPEKGAMLLVKR